MKEADEGKIVSLISSLDGEKGGDRKKLNERERFRQFLDLRSEDTEEEGVDGRSDDGRSESVVDCIVEEDRERHQNEMRKEEKKRATHQSSKPSRKTPPASHSAPPSSYSPTLYHQEE